MKSLLLFLIISLVSSCSNHSIPEHEKVADRITALTAKKIENETGLRLIGTGGGMMHQVRMMGMSFNYFGEMSIEKGRKLLTYCVDEYLSAINSDEQIKTYLTHYPFTCKDIEIRIFVYQSDHTDVPIGELSVVAAYDGCLTYKIRQPGPVILKRIYKETYGEALKLLTVHQSDSPQAEAVYN